MTAPALIPFCGPAELANLSARLPAIFLADARSSERFWEFLAANIRNKNTRRAYYKASHAGFPNGVKAVGSSNWRA